MYAWQFQRTDNKIGPDFSEAIARQYLRPSLSEWTAPRQIMLKRRWQSIAYDWKSECLVACAYCTLMAWCSRGRVRSVLVVASAILGTISLAMAFRNEVSNILGPGDYQYIQDFEYCQNLDWQRKEVEPGIVIAYEKSAWNYGGACKHPYRIVAFMDGHQESMTEPEFLNLAAEQGIEIKRTDKPSKRYVD